MGALALIGLERCISPPARARPWWKLGVAGTFKSPAARDSYVVTWQLGHDAPARSLKGSSKVVEMPLSHPGPQQFVQRYRAQPAHSRNRAPSCKRRLASFQVVLT